VLVGPAAEEVAVWRVAAMKETKGKRVVCRVVADGKGDGGLYDCRPSCGG
jgi:hypothetical protein